VELFASKYVSFVLYVRRLFLSFLNKSIHLSVRTVLHIKLSIVATYFNFFFRITGGRTTTDHTLL
jgi:hypothetical protein